MSPGIIPSALGNIIGGGLMIGVYYWWIYLFMEAPVAVDSVTFTPSAKSPSWGFGRKGVIQGDEEQCTSDSTKTPKGQRSD